MRVTNNMILKNSSYNIGGTKSDVDTTMNQMTTQKKISKPSDDPVVAIRSLRLQTNIDRVDQYYKKNIPDAQSWIDVTETALINMREVMTDVRTQAVNGATDTLTQDDRNVILNQLKALQQQLYAEGNADYAGRTVFTGYRTDKELVFSEDEKDASDKKISEYTITETFSYDKMEQFRYYDGEVNLPAVATVIPPATGIGISDGPQSSDDITESNYYRFRASYKDITDEKTAQPPTTTTPTPVLDVQVIDPATTPPTPVTLTPALTISKYDTEEDWSNAAGGKTVNANEIILIRSTGEFILGDEIADTIRNNKYSLQTTYEKVGFSKGDLRPEYYFDCWDVSNQENEVQFKKYDDNGEELGYDISYTIASNQELTVNIEASDAFDSSIQRDVDDMIAAVTRSIAAHEKLEKIDAMKKEAAYQSSDLQAKLREWQSAAQKEADYFDDHLQRLYSSEIGKCDAYLEKINLSISQVGCNADQLEMTKTRMGAQQQTLAQLQSDNDNLDLSEIIINYTAMYNAYQASLQAAGKLSGQTLLNYL